MLRKASEVDKVTAGKHLSMRTCSCRIKREDKIVWKIYLTKYFWQMTERCDTLWIYLWCPSVEIANQLCFNDCLEYLTQATIGANAKNASFFPTWPQNCLPKIREQCFAPETSNSLKRMPVSRSQIDFLSEFASGIEGQSQTAECHGLSLLSVWVCKALGGHLLA